MFRRSINIKFWLGLFIIIGICAASITDIWWLPHDPFYMEIYRTSLSETGSIVYNPPAYPFGTENLLSTDLLGRDIFARLVSGAKVTFSIVLILTFFKMMLAIPLGLLAGSNVKFLKKFTELNSFVFSGFPTLLAAIFIFSMPIFQEMSYWSKIISMVLIIALLEWSRIAITIKGRSEQIMKEPYIEGARVLGRSTIGILYFHVWKNIRSDVAVLFVFECARSLMLLGSMALFGVYFLDTIVINNEPLPPTRVSLTPEWGTILGESRYHILTNPLVTFIIAATIVIATLAFNLIGEGLKEKYLIPKSKHVRTWSFKTVRFLLPFRTALTVVFVLIIVLTSAIYLAVFKADETAFATDNSIQVKLKELGNRNIGSPESKRAGRVIAEEWGQIQKSNLAIFDEKTYSVKIKYQDEASMTVKFGNDEIHIKKDEDSFQLPNVTVESGEVTAPVVNVQPEDSMEKVISNISSGSYDGKILALPIQDDNQTFFDNLNAIMMEALRNSDVKGIVYLDYTTYITSLDSRHNIEADINLVTEDKIRYFPVFVVKGNNIPLLEQAQSVSLKVKLPGVDSSIVYTQIGEVDKEKRNVVFYSYYDTESLAHLTKEQRDAYIDYNAKSVDLLTKIMKSLSAKGDNRFNYYFAALDGTNGKYVGFRHWVSKNQPLMNDKTILVQIQNEEVPPQLKEAGSTIATYNTNIFTQAERNAIERSISEASWKTDLVPFIGKGALHFPPKVNAPVKHINLISNDDDFLTFIDLFLSNLDKEYIKYYDSIEMKKLEQDRQFELLAQEGLKIKEELNKKLSEAIKNNDRNAFLALQNQDNQSFYKEQLRWFDEIMYKFDSWVEIKAEVIWVSLTKNNGYEAKFRVSFVDSNTSEVRMMQEVVYQLISTSDGYKFNDLPFKQKSEGNIQLFYLPQDENRVDGILVEIKETLQILQELFGWKPEKPLVIKLYPDDSSLRATVPKFPSMNQRIVESNFWLEQEQVTIKDKDGEAIPVEKDDFAANGWSEQDEAIKLTVNGKYNMITHEISKRMLSDITNGNLSYSLNEGFAYLLLNNIVKKQSGQLIFSSELANQRAVENFKANFPLLTWNEFLSRTYGVGDYKKEGEVFAHYLWLQGSDKLLLFFDELSKNPYVESRLAHKSNVTVERTMKALEKVYGPLNELYDDLHKYYNSLW